MKGSSVDRSVLEKKDIQLIQDGRTAQVEDRYKKTILKDNDFKALGYYLKLSKKDAMMMQSNVASDAEFLYGYNLTDYSILLTIHRYNDDDADKVISNYRIFKSTDGKWIYNLSIIDYFCVIYFLFRLIILQRRWKRMESISEAI
jgi:hypothetical protein